MARGQNFWSGTKLDFSRVNPDQVRQKHIGSFLNTHGGLELAKHHQVLHLNVFFVVNLGEIETTNNIINKQQREAETSRQDLKARATQHTIGNDGHITDIETLFKTEDSSSTLKIVGKLNIYQ